MTDGPAAATWRPAWPWLLLALAVLAGAVALLMSRPAAPPPPTPAGAAVPSWPASPFGAASAEAGGSGEGQVARAVAPVSAVPPRTPATAPPPVAPASDPDDLAAHVPPGVVPTMNQVIEQLHQRGIRTGLGAFNPPGTKPPLVGLAVPEGFELPPGYLRHEQATDDGQAIEAILMFDPDHPPPAAAGRALRTPAERVVPPELAPPGLVARTITLPPPRPAPRPGSAPR